MSLFKYQPELAKSIDNAKLREKVGDIDIRQPWIDMSEKFEKGGVIISPFEAKAFFALGMMRRYILSANAVLRDLRHLGFLSAFSLLSSGVELLGRCVHECIEVRQNPVGCSTQRLKEGFKKIRLPHIKSAAIVVVNHPTEPKKGLEVTVDNLEKLRHLAVHGGCISKDTEQIVGHVELLHELRRGFYGVPEGEPDPMYGPGPHAGALDRYCEELCSNTDDLCTYLAEAALSPDPLKFQRGAWPFHLQVVYETKQHVENNYTCFARGKPTRLLLSGGHKKKDDFFQLYY